MNPVIAGVLQSNPTQGDYDKLPQCLKQYYSPEQWSFLSDAQKANVSRDECEPEC